LRKVKKMEELLRKAAISGATFVGKAAWSYAASVAMKKVQGFVKEGADPLIQEKCLLLKGKLERKLSILTPIIDEIEISAAQGKSLSSSCLGSLRLTEDLKEKLQKAASGLSGLHQVKALEECLEMVNDIIPLLNLSLQSQKVDQSNQMSDAPISFSRLLHASGAISTAEATLRFAEKGCDKIQVGFPFSVRVYTLFEGSARKASVSNVTWKEDFFKAQCCIQRLSSRTRVYNLLITQDLNDGRFHDGFENIRSSDGFVAGSKRIIPITDVAQMFYTSSGQLLNLEESCLPVLVFKVITKAESNEELQETPKTSLKTEWIALELYKELAQDFDSEGEEEPDLKKLQLNNEEDSDETESITPFLSQLCLLEYLIRLCSLEEREGQSHTRVTDFTFNQYFYNTASGAGAASQIPSTSARKPAVSSESPLRGKALMDRLISA
jgi:hypothetical protein